MAKMSITAGGMGRRSRLLSAVAGALQHAEVDAPGADCLAILVGHDAGELMEVAEVVDGPGGEELRECYGAERGMASWAGKVVRLEIEGLEGGEAFFAEGGEFVEELLERFRLRLFHLREAIKGSEGAGVAVLKDEARARNPVVALGEDHVAHDVVWAPGIFAFIAANPGIGETTQERVESGWSAGEQSDGLGHGIDEYRLLRWMGCFAA
jgi:hypothetical protein